MVDKSLLDEDGRFKFVPQEVAAAIASKHKFATHRFSHVIYVYGDGSYTFDGEELIREEVRTLLGDEAKEGRVNEVVAHIRETTYTQPEKFNPPLNLINVKNATLNIETQEATPHSPDVIFLNELPVNYDPAAGCPKIIKFLSEVISEDDIAVIQEIVGYCLLRDYRFAKAVMLLGEGSNGKSTLLNLITALLGEKNVATPSLQDLIYNSFAKGSLFGKLANIHADIPSTRLKHTGIFKMLTGQDIIWADVKHLKAFEFKNHAKLIYSANELPQTDDTSEAFWRRWIVIDFPNTFPDDDPKTDPTILDKLITPEELSGFLNWALEGLRRLLSQNKFTTTKTREQVEREWIARTDSLRAFIAEQVTFNPDYFVTKDGLFEAYCDFCDERELIVIEKAMVGRRIKVLLPKILEFTPRPTGKQVRAWKGIRLSPPYDNRNYKTEMTEVTEISTYLLPNSKNSYKIDEKGVTSVTTVPSVTLVEVVAEINRGIVGPDGKTYGPFAVGTITAVPTQTAIMLERHGFVKIRREEAPYG